MLKIKDKGGVNINKNMDGVNYSGKRNCKDFENMKGGEKSYSFQ